MGQRRQSAARCRLHRLTSPPIEPAGALIERERCPLCDASPRRTLYHCAFSEPPIRDYLTTVYAGVDDDDLRVLSDGAFVLEECSNCTLVWQRIAPPEALLTRLYESSASGEGGLGRHDNLAYYRSAVEEILLVLELVGKPPGEVSVLDFGMGWGQWPRLAAAFGCRSSGVELDRHQAEYARAHGVDVIAFEDLPARAFDFVNTEQVFEHLVDPREAVHRLGCSLVDEGWLKVAVPRGDGIADRLRNPDWTAPRGSSRSLNAVAPLEHLNCFTKRALTELGDQGGLRRDAPGMRALYATTIGLWPARRLARNVARPPVRRFAPGASFFRR